MARRGFGSVLGGIVAAMGLVLALDALPWFPFWPTVTEFLDRQAFHASHPLLVDVLWRAARETVLGLQGLYPLLLAVACLAGIGGVLARSLAWARVREGRPDPLERLRARRGLRRGLALAPAALVLLAGVTGFAIDLRWLLQLPSGSEWDFALRDLLATPLWSAALAALLTWPTRAAIDALLAPVALDSEARPRDDGDIVFSAIAVTPRAQAAVAALAFATVATVAFGVTAGGDPRFPWVLAAYVAAAIASPLALRRAARIAVGIDGVWVRDTSHARFLPYRELREARARGADLELVGAGAGAHDAAVLRLQMHGADAARRDEVVARVHEGIARARRQQTAAAESLVQALPGRRVAATVSPLGVDYRSPSLGREQLWELVEGAKTDGPTRTAAAAALAAALDDADRARLRVAAAHCAEPRVRVALDALADDREAPSDARSEADAEAPARGHRATVGRTRA